MAVQRKNSPGASARPRFAIALEALPVQQDAREWVLLMDVHAFCDAMRVVMASPSMRMRKLQTSWATWAEFDCRACGRKQMRDHSIWSHLHAPSHRAKEHAFAQRIQRAWRAWRARYYAPDGPGGRKAIARLQKAEEEEEEAGEGL